MIIGSQVQEHRFEVWLDRGEFEDVQTLLGQQPGDGCRVEPVAALTDLEQPAGQRLNTEAGHSEHLGGLQMVGDSYLRRQLTVSSEDVAHIAFGEQPAAADDGDRVGDLLYLSLIHI